MLQRSRQVLTIGVVQAGPSSGIFLECIKCNSEGGIARLRLENPSIGGGQKQIFGEFRRDRTQLQGNSNQGTLVPWKTQAYHACAKARNGQMAKIGRAFHTDLVNI